MKTKKIMILKKNNYFFMHFLDNEFITNTNKITMNPSSSTEVDTSNQTTQTSSANLTPTQKSENSPKNHEHQQIFFQTIKRANCQSKKKNIFFSTIRQKQKTLPEPLKEVPKTHIVEPKQEILKIPKFKENYLDLLINSLNTQLNNGFLTLEYLNSTTYPKFSDFYNSSNLDDESETYSRKCENKICAVVVDDPKKVFYAKFTSSFSYKPQTMWLCDKCFAAYKLGNYCYFCNVIYRDFEFNQQYYDRKKWILCEYCQKWEHMQCEEKKGKYKNIEELALNSNFKYMCPFCRKENRQYIRFHSKNSKSIYI